MTNIHKEVLFDKDAPLENSQLAILKQHFPNCFDKNGAFLPEKLTEFVQSSDTPINKEAYSLQWLGKSYAKLLRDVPPQTLLSEDKQHNSQEENRNSQNVLIKGDNLEVLKHLKNAYSEKVKMIYIDPPYNTGSDGFVYQDDRKFSKEQLAELTGMPLDEAEKVLKFTDKKSNSHSAWLTFMSPRLYIARILLQQDGVIFISIDDNEVAQLRLLCDEVFGEENFVANLTWKNKKGGGNDSKHIAVENESILMFCKSLNKLEKLFHKYSDNYLKRYKELDEKGRFFWDTFKRKSGKQYYKIECPDGSFLEKDELGNPISWLRSEKTFKNDLANGDIRIIKIKEKWSVQFKQRLPEGKKPRSIIDSYGTTSEGSNECLKIFKKNIFENPKPTSLIKHFLTIATRNNDLILDFFAGSGTTADAVMQLNAEDGGNRQFILVQLPETIDPKSNKTAYDFVRNELGVAEPTIFDITKERISRSSKKILAENPQASGDFGFKIYETVDNFCLTTDEELSTNQEMFPKHSFSDKQYQTLLTSWRLHDGSRLTDSVTTKQLADYTAYLCDKNLYLLHPKFNSDSIKALIESLDKEPDFTPNRIIFYGEHIDSGKQKELQQALDSYANKKDLKISLLARY